MLLRRVTEHVKAQNWTAVMLDFLIVVIGVFIGIQVSNWNDSRAFEQRERELLAELRTDIETAMRITTGRREYLEGVAAAGGRSLDFTAAGLACADDCWRRLVDFFHASQWSDVRVNRTAYDNLRRLGLPRSRAVAEAVEAYYGHNDSLMRVLSERPVYRKLVRGLIPLAAQNVLWLKCHGSENGIERLIPDCAASVPAELSRASVEQIRNHPEIRPTLTQWAGAVALAAPYLTEQNVVGERAVAAIDAELGSGE